MMKISIIIPTYNEAENIARLIKYLLQHGGNSLGEIIVADGGSSDTTVQLANQAGAQAIISLKKGRGAQMDFGAEKATGNVFYFIHADVFPPPSFIQDIKKALLEGYACGRYCMKFDSNKWYLKLNTFFTRFDLFVCYGGDQTLFVTRELYHKAGGYNKQFRIMEDFEFTQRLKEFGSYKIIKKGALISARKYDTNSWLKVQLANKKIVSMYKKGASQEEMAAMYRKMLNYN